MGGCGQAGEGNWVNRALCVPNAAQPRNPIAMVYVLAVERIGSEEWWGVIAGWGSARLREVEVGASGRGAVGGCWD